MRRADTLEDIAAVPDLAGVAPFVVLAVVVQLVVLHPPFRQAVAINIVKALQLLGANAENIGGVSQSQHILLVAKMGEVLDFGSAVIKAVVGLQAVRLAQHIVLRGEMIEGAVLDGRGNDAPGPVVNQLVAAHRHIGTQIAGRRVSGIVHLAVLVTGGPEAELVYAAAGNRSQLGLEGALAKVNRIVDDVGTEHREAVAVEHQTAPLGVPNQGQVRPGVRFQLRRAAAAAHRDNHFFLIAAAGGVIQAAINLAHRCAVLQAQAIAHKGVTLSLKVPVFAGQGHSVGV